MKKDVFAEFDLPSGNICSILEPKGKHFFNAHINSKGNSELMLKYLILEIISYNNEKISEKDLDEMDLKDVLFMTEIIASILNDSLLKNIK